MAVPTGFTETESRLSAQILESAATLARAEVKLLWSHTRQVGGRVAVVLGLTWLAMMLTQVALLLLALSPLIGASYGGTMVAASTAPSALLSLVAWAVCLKKWSGLNEAARGRQPPAALAIELSGDELGRR